MKVQNDGRITSDASTLVAPATSAVTRPVPPAMNTQEQARSLLACPGCGQSGPTKVGYWPDELGLSSRVSCVCGFQTRGGCEKTCAEIWNTRHTPNPSADVETRAREVTRDKAVSFLEVAFRNIELPPLNVDDLEDIRDGLTRFTRAALTAPVSESTLKTEARIVDWLRGQPSLISAPGGQARPNSPRRLADAIARREHVTGEKG